MIIANNNSYDLAKEFIELKKTLNVENIKKMHVLATKLCEDILISHNIFVEGPSTQSWFISKTTYFPTE